MTDFRTKADQVVEQGRAERGEWEPHGAPLRVYQWWATNGGQRPRTENFCHYWRVVAIWAPLLFIRNRWAPVGRVLGRPFRGLGNLLHDRGATIALALLVISAAMLLGVLGWGLVSLILEVGMMTSLLYAGIVVGSAAVLVVIIVGIGYLLGMLGNYISRRRTSNRLAMLRDEEKYYEEHGEYPTKAEGPGIFTRWLSVVADFLVLVGQVIRVNKWKICPIVKIEDGN